MAQRPIIDQPQGPTQTETVAIVLSVLWVIAVALFFWLRSADEIVGGLRHIVMLLVMFVPVGMAGIVLATARAMRAMEAEMSRLQRSLDALRQPSVAPQSQPAQRQMTAPAAAAVRPAAKPTARSLPVEQPALALGSLPEDDSPPIARPDLIRALNFPDSEDDAAGFSALRLALRDRTARHLVQASQDVLTLLSQDGIYMDDLRPDTPDADLWRRFAKGERGHGMQAVGAVREEAALAIATARMREDTVFRDAVHHFLRRFDLILAGFEEQAKDADLMALAETRTARAFMLLGRASRIFD
ncbi:MULTISPECIES: hypothetical protein [unclassified Yoonia]|uniref:hypothetical protein n=1 Tax=unclassified Yoonia TaxID=2629118 RepID=UPI002AFF880C|nr:MULTISPECIES: hypothetical protein [unclassified Yoonia]